jgi:AraC-like DNA-binding protein
MEIVRIRPHPALGCIVRSFEERRSNLGTTVLTWPLPARPHQIIDIYLAEPFKVRVDGGPMTQAPETVVVGPQSSRRTQLYLSGEIHVFNILFQPTGLNRLVGIDMTSLVNQGIAARDVLGNRASGLSDLVRSALDFPARVAAAERYIGAMLDNALAPADAIDTASSSMLATCGRARIDDLVARSGLSARQFQRRFTRQVGLSPKLYARTIRFDTALMMHRKTPAKPWTEIAHATGYFDQAHFVRECHALAGAVPSQFIGDWENILSPIHD